MSTPGDTPFSAPQTPSPTLCQCTCCPVVLLKHFLIFLEQFWSVSLRMTSIPCCSPSEHKAGIVALHVGAEGDSRPSWGLWLELPTDVLWGVSAHWDIFSPYLTVVCFRSFVRLVVRRLFKIHLQSDTVKDIVYCRFIASVNIYCVFKNVLYSHCPSFSDYSP